MQQSPKATSSSFTEDILSFNEVSENFSEAFQVQTLKLLLALVMLEQVVVHHSSSTGKDNLATKTKVFKIVSRYALKNAMYCHLKSYSCTKIQFPSNRSSVL